MTQATTAPAKTRAQIPERTLRKDPWWRQPAINGAALAVVVVYLTWASLVNANYFWKPYISPLYSPCLVTTCTPGAGYAWIPWLTWLSPAVLIIGGPLGFRLTCYYYRKAYYRAFWRAPAACAVADGHASYSGETRFPLILQNVHRYFFWVLLAFNVILTIDAIEAFDQPGLGIGVSIGTVVLCFNALFLWLYSLSCHACRHFCGGQVRSFAKHPIRHKLWKAVTPLNAMHMRFAWASLFVVAFADFYVRLVASGTITDPGFHF